MEFRILGPLEVVADGRVVAIGGGKQRLVPGVLLLHSNEVVSIDRLVDLVWAEKAPAAARTSVQVYVSGLRKALGEGVLLTQPPGYVLRVNPGDLDAEPFEALVRAASSFEPRHGRRRWQKRLRCGAGPRWRTHRSPSRQRPSAAWKRRAWSRWRSASRPTSTSAVRHSWWGS